MKTILSLGARAACAALCAGVLSCSASDDPYDLGEDDLTGESTDALTLIAPTYVTVRADHRRCVAPRCGGYFLRDVNQQGDERYASRLDFTQARLPANALFDARSAPADELVLRGRWGGWEGRFHTRPFVVLDAYRGMPGVNARTGDAFYRVSPRTPPIACLVAPCPNEIATVLNTDVKVAIDRVSVESAALPLVDQGWLGSRAEDHGAVVAGVLVPGDHFPGGYEKVLDARQVFIHLPERVGPCPAMPIVYCEGNVPIYERTDDRCLVQRGCVEPELCMPFVPECSEGYSLSRWAAAPNGCAAFACDPTFVLR